MAQSRSASTANAGTPASRTAPMTRPPSAADRTRSQAPGPGLRSGRTHCGISSPDPMRTASPAISVPIRSAITNYILRCVSSNPLHSSSIRLVFVIGASRRALKLRRVLRTGVCYSLERPCLRYVHLPLCEHGTSRKSDADQRSDFGYVQTRSGLFLVAGETLRN